MLPVATSRQQDDLRSGYGIHHQFAQINFPNVHDDNEACVSHFDPEIELTRPILDEAARSLYEMCLTEVHVPMGNIKQAFR
jgi:hypothetical protein